MDADRVSPRPQVPIRLLFTICTCVAAPSQWDARTVAGDWLYLRYRHGKGMVARGPSRAAVNIGGELIAYWIDGSNNGMISLDEFCALANLVPPDPKMVFERVYGDE